MPQEANGFSAGNQPHDGTALRRAGHIPDPRIPRQIPDNMGRILVVSSNSHALETMRQRLEEFNFEVATASGPTGAIKKAVEYIPECVLLDTQPYEIGVYYLCLAMKKDPLLSRVPVVALQSASDRRDRQYAMNMGAVECFIKPVRLSELLGRLRTCVFQRRRLLHAESCMVPIVYASSNLSRVGLMRRAVNAKNFLKKTHYRLVPVSSLVELRDKLKAVTPRAIVLDEDVGRVDTSLMCYSLKSDPKYRELPLLVFLFKPEDARRFGTADARLGLKCHRAAIDTIDKIHAEPVVS